MIRRSFAVFFLLTTFGWPKAYCAGDILLRTKVQPEEAWVGQRVVVHIDVLGANGWAQITRFGDVDLPGAYMIRTNKQVFRLQENIGGEAFTGERYEFSVYPQRAGPIEVPPFPVEVTVSTWGVNATQTVHHSQAPAVSINARLPPGADRIRGLISSARVTAEQQWTPNELAPRVGDALQRTVIMRADDVSGMAFVPLQYANLPGIGSYPTEPEIVDSMDRGSLTGQRTETVTYIFERPGTFDIPALELTWWNVAEERLETLNLPGLSLKVAPAPEITAQTAVYGVTERVRARGLWLAGASLVLVAVTLWRFGRPIKQRFQTLRHRIESSEANCFKRVLDSVRSKNARVALSELMHWLDRINEAGTPAQLGNFVSQYADSRGEAAIAQLLAAAAANEQLEDPEWLSGVLKGMRRQWKRRRTAHVLSASALPGMNSPARSGDMFSD